MSCFTAISRIPVSTELHEYEFAVRDNRAACEGGLREHLEEVLVEASCQFSTRGTKECLSCYDII